MKQLGNALANFLHSKIFSCSSLTRVEKKNRVSKVLRINYGVKGLGHSEVLKKYIFFIGLKNPLYPLEEGTEGLIPARSRVH